MKLILGGRTGWSELSNLYKLIHKKRLIKDSQKIISNKQDKSWNKLIINMTEADLLFYTVVDDYINTMKTTFYISCLQAFFELQVYK